MNALDPTLFKVCITDLPPPLKRRVWIFIQQQRPELAALLTGGDKLFPIEKFKEIFGDPKIWTAATDTDLTPQALYQFRAAFPGAVRTTAQSPSQTAPRSPQLHTG